MNVRRLLFLAIVTVLIGTTAGAANFIVQEPCGPQDTSNAPDGCPPTCVRCGCCTQPAVPALATNAADFGIPVLIRIPHLPQLPDIDPRDILHVPKNVLA